MFNINKLKEALLGYIEVKLELFKLDMAEHLSKILAQLVAYLVIIVFLGLVILFLSIASALYLNEILQSSHLGFILVSAFYTVLLICVFILLKTGNLKSFFESVLIPKSKEETQQTKDT